MTRQLAFVSILNILLLVANRLGLPPPGPKCKTRYKTSKFLFIFVEVTIIREDFVITYAVNIRNIAMSLLMHYDLNVGVLLY